MLAAVVVVKVVLEVLLELEVLEVLEVPVSTHNLREKLVIGLTAVDVTTIVATLE